jgi:hypothetical protein
VLPSPKVRVKLLFDGDPKVIDIYPPAIPSELPVIMLDVPPMWVLEMSAVPALFHTARLFDHVADPMPDGIRIELPEAMLPLLPSVVTTPLLVLLSPEVGVKLLVDGDPETIDALTIGLGLLGSVGGP